MGTAMGARGAGGGRGEWTVPAAEGVVVGG